MDSSRLVAFNNVREQVGCCGIWCGSCAVGNGSLSLLTAKYAEVLRSHGLEHWAPPDLNYGAFAHGLAVVKRLASCAGCRKGGGRDACELRSCCGSRALEDCLECGERTGCPHAPVLEQMRSGARAAGLSVKDARGSSAPLLQAWEEGLRSRWPSAILFMEDG